MCMLVRCRSHRAEESQAARICVQVGGLVGSRLDLAPLRGRDGALPHTPPKGNTIKLRKGDEQNVEISQKGLTKGSKLIEISV